MWKNVVAIGAHPDDIEFGCGGALLRHVAMGATVTMIVMSDGVRGGDPVQRAAEQERAAASLGAKVVMLGLPDGRLGEFTDLVDALEDALAPTGADLVYTHLGDDTHQDHVLAHRAVKVATRNLHNVLLFESPRSPVLSTGIAVDISGVIGQKVDLLCEHTSQMGRQAELEQEGLRARARLHGMRFGYEYAEVFTPLRLGLPLG